MRSSPVTLIVAVRRSQSALCCAEHSPSRASPPNTSLSSRLQAESRALTLDPTRRRRAFSAMAADTHHNVRPSSIPSQSACAPRVVVARGLPGAASMDLECCPFCREVSPSILNALTIQSIGTARKILTIGDGRPHAASPATRVRSGQRAAGSSFCKPLSVNILRSTLHTATVCFHVEIPASVQVWQ
jgi:hypothetical protein